MIPVWSDGKERPTWYVGSAIQDAISEYFRAARDREVARLVAENAEMRLKLEPAEMAKGAGA